MEKSRMSLSATQSRPTPESPDAAKGTTPIRVLLVDDHSIVRQGLKEILDRTAEYEVVGEAADGVQAVELARKVRPDVVLMDLIMPNKDGIEASREILEAVPSTHILVLTASTADDAIINALAAGASGYLQKVCGRDELLAAIRDAAEDRSSVSVEMLRRALGAEQSAPERTRASGSKLTARERDILTHFARGNSYGQVAAIMGNSTVTVRNTIYRIQQKLGVTTKQEIVAWAAFNGLLDNDQSAPTARSRE
ncbi:MAG: response regulator transcription factor [Chloroflexi bacterium]|nr:response regulator transcription factor [Chloroflexota bacterium]MYD15656.1 response regulator transcription factor [Chloroflexota bacterium]MYJ01640.1 response regulator transcription factor [Chloroflexota bacterium]